MRCEQMGSRIVLMVAVVAGAAGMWVSGTLVKRDAGIWPVAQDSLFARVCRASEALGADCAASVKARGATLAAPLPWYSPREGLTLRRVHLPLSFFGLSYFVLLTTWLLVVGRPRGEDGRWRSLPRWVAFFGGAVSVTLLVLMATRLRPLCIWCVIAHLANLVLVVAIMRSCATAARSRRSAQNVDRGFAQVVNPARFRLAVVAVAFSILVVAGLGYHRREKLAMARQVHALIPYRDIVTALRSDPEFLLREHFRQPVAVAACVEGALVDPTLSQLVLFTDYTCGACRCTARRVSQMITPAFNGKVTVTVRHVPRCRACTDSAGNDHSDACRAAHAAEAARVVGGDDAFAKLHARLYEHRGAWTDEALTQLARGIGLDEAAFGRALTSPSVRRTIAHDVAAARALGVDAVPAMFLDGRRVGRLCVDNLVFWRAVADAADADRERYLGMNR